MSEPPTEAGGLHNPSVRHERTDVDTKAIMTFVAALAGGIAAVMLAMLGVFALFWRQEEAKKQPTYPLAAQERQQTSLAERVPPSPRIEGLGRTRPEHSAGRNVPGTSRELVEAQETVLNTYRWTNPQQTAAQIPIEEAIKRMAKRGALPARNDGRPVDEYLAEPSQTSSGQRARGQSP